MECWLKVVCMFAVATVVLSASIGQNSGTVQDKDAASAVDVYNKGLPGNSHFKIFEYDTEKRMNTYVRSKRDGEETGKKEEKEKENNDKENGDEEQNMHSNHHYDLGCLCCVLEMLGMPCKTGKNLTHILDQSMIKGGGKWNQRKEVQRLSMESCVKVLLVLGMTMVVNSVPPSQIPWKGNKALTVAIDLYNKEHHGDSVYKLLAYRLDESTDSQQLRFTVKETVCRKSETQSKTDNCEFRENGLVKDCTAFFSERKYRTLEVNCDTVSPQNARVRRQVRSASSSIIPGTRNNRRKCKQNRNRQCIKIKEKKPEEGEEDSFNPGSLTSIAGVPNFNPGSFSLLSSIDIPLLTEVEDSINGA
ncbi:uncharacterized protein LOC115466518 [Microcaecilia unicolor]|uniref:Uncharacterized protein LOC115466518 n=1 Tax=Microcaecilia unicolor TaxID=1415580 RepID=A0A6P7XSQ2_9AMPH|nr:uncharacterized protein LOC115466518 [Microcaecilia unicolor]